MSDFNTGQLIKVLINSMLTIELHLILQLFYKQTFFIHENKNSPTINFKSAHSIM